LATSCCFVLNLGQDEMLEAVETRVGGEHNL
jgi:hypothetical protein